jgi:hypothetical protein
VGGGATRFRWACPEIIRAILLSSFKKVDIKTFFIRSQQHLIHIIMFCSIKKSMIES